MLAVESRLRKMMQSQIVRNTLLVLGVLMSPLLWPAPPSDVPAVPPAEYAARRARVREVMSREAGSDALLLLRAPRPDHYAGDVDYLYRPDNDLYYLTGIHEPGFALLLSARQLENGHEILFYTPQDFLQQIWEGERLDAAAASELSAIPQARIKEMKDLAGLLEKLFDAQPHPHHGHSGEGHSRRPFYFSTGQGFAPGKDPTEAYRFLLKTLGSAAFFVELKSPAALVHPLRQIKSAAELAQIETAISVTGEALRNVMRAARPEMHEYEIRAIIEGTFLRLGCEGVGFPSIVGTGPNGCTLHYQKYDRRAQQGELVLMDVGAEFRFYSADVTRTIPLSGRFSRRQREIYEVVLAAQKAAIDVVKPGVTLDDINKVAREKIAVGLRRVELIEADSQLEFFFPHGTSHGLGLDVHDPMPTEILAPGMVITVEPGVYIAAENIGIRIEDDVLVTDDGCRVLSTHAPKEIAEIEALMHSRSF